jgi:hypothetical protein
MLIWALRVWFLLVLITQTTVVVWACLQESLFQIPAQVTGDPWFIATLYDTYFAFFVFYWWVCYRESSWLSRILWFLLVMGLGNVAMAAYMVILLFRLPSNASAKDVLLKSR